MHSAEPPISQPSHSDFENFCVEGGIDIFSEKNLFDLGINPRSPFPPQTCKLCFKLKVCPRRQINLQFLSKAKTFWVVGRGPQIFNKQLILKQILYILIF
jgi:hypothetical protein